MHAQHAANAGSEAAIITAEDTDILVLCLSFQKDITYPTYQKCGTYSLNALKMLRKNISYQQAFSQLGQSWNVIDDLFQKLEPFACRMYIVISNTSEISCTKRGEIESRQLPSRKPCLFMNVQRANYQGVI